LDKKKRNEFLSALTATIIEHCKDEHPHHVIDELVHVVVGLSVLNNIPREALDGFFDAVWSTHMDNDSASFLLFGGPGNLPEA
jgi:hypothetical protein